MHAPVDRLTGKRVVLEEQHQVVAATPAVLADDLGDDIGDVRGLHRAFIGPRVGSGQIPHGGARGTVVHQPRAQTLLRRRPARHTRGIGGECRRTGDLLTGDTDAGGGIALADGEQFESGGIDLCALWDVQIAKPQGHQLASGRCSGRDVVHLQLGPMQHTRIAWVDHAMTVRGPGVEDANVVVGIAGLPLRMVEDLLHDRAQIRGENLFVRDRIGNVVPQHDAVGDVAGVRARAAEGLDVVEIETVVVMRGRGQAEPAVDVVVGLEGRATSGAVAAVRKRRHGARVQPEQFQIQRPAARVAAAQAKLGEQYRRAGRVPVDVLDVREAKPDRAHAVGQAVEYALEVAVVVVEAGRLFGVVRAAFTRTDHAQFLPERGNIHQVEIEAVELDVVELRRGAGAGDRDQLLGVIVAVRDSHRHIGLAGALDVAGIGVDRRHRKQDRAARIGESHQPDVHVVHVVEQRVQRILHSLESILALSIERGHRAGRVEDEQHVRLDPIRDVVAGVDLGVIGRC